MVRLIQVFAPVKRNGNTILNQISDGKNNFMTSGLIKRWPQPTLKTIKPLNAFTKTALLCSSEINLEQSASLSFVRDFSHSSARQSRESDNSETRDDEVLKDLALSAAPLARSVFSAPYNNGIANTRPAPRNGLSDLHMFLQEVGTDPKEARFWLKHFQSAVDPQRPFAVVQVAQEVIHNKKTLHSLCSCLSFLHRHQMQVIIIHGPETPINNSKEEYWGYRRQLMNDSMILFDALAYNDAVSRPLFHGASFFHIQHPDPSCRRPQLMISMDAMQWALRSSSVVVVQSLGELDDGRLVPIDVMHATGAIAKELKPLKVLVINNYGGLTNDKGQVIANINIPGDLNNIFQSTWCTTSIKEKINDIASLLHCLPSQSAIVISSATRLLAELFTHRGSGTFFKKSECIYKFTNLRDVDSKKLSLLIESGFRRVLDKQYLEKLNKQLNTVYVVEGYTAAAIITNEEGLSVPYLDKFVVSASRSGESLGQMVWDAICADFPQLFWRSRNSNIINTWYFTQADGSRRFDQWTVFWYGSIPESQANQLVEYALTLPSSFTGTVNTKQLNRL